MRDFGEILRSDPSGRPARAAAFRKKPLRRFADVPRRTAFRSGDRGAELHAQINLDALFWGGRLGLRRVVPGQVNFLVRRQGHGPVPVRLFALEGRLCVQFPLRLERLADAFELLRVVVDEFRPIAGTRDFNVE